MSVDCNRCLAYELILCRQGKVVCETQDPIPQSEYHARLEGELEEGDLERTDPNIRYWSDYSRVFFDRKSIQAIPDALESIEAGWSVGQDLFQRYNEVYSLSPRFVLFITLLQDTELMEGAFRLLVENCDNFQVGSFHAISSPPLSQPPTAGLANDA